ncbi:MAG: creatininase family protein [Acidimicrobiales bacterium]
MNPVLPTSTTTDPAVRNPVVAVLPVGSFEQHGPHLPLATDSLVAVAITSAISARFEVLALPPVTFSCSHEHASFAGTVSLSAGTLAAIISDVAESLARSGLVGMLVVNGHGGNHVLANVVQEANVTGRLRVGLYPARQDWSEARTAAG